MARKQKQNLVSAPAVHPTDLPVDSLLNVHYVRFDLVLRDLHLVLRDLQLLLQPLQQQPTATPGGRRLAGVGGGGMFQTWSEVFCKVVRVR